MVVHRKESRVAVLLVLEVGLQVVHRVVVVLHAQVVHQVEVVLHAQVVHRLVVVFRKECRVAVLLVQVVVLPVVLQIDYSFVANHEHQTVQVVGLHAQAQAVDFLVLLVPEVVPRKVQLAVLQDHDILSEIQEEVGLLGLLCLYIQVASLRKVQEVED